MLFVGGTPLYLKGLLRGIFEGPPADWLLRRQLADEAAQRGGDWLHQRLAAVDAVAAARLHPNDTRRLIRAIEVYEKRAGRSASGSGNSRSAARPRNAASSFWIGPRRELPARIQRRVREMFAAGLIEEVRRLCSLGPSPKGRGKAFQEIR